MDYAKLDAGLAAAIEAPGDGTAGFVVFIRSNRVVGEREAAALRSAGIEAPTPGKRILTATLGPEAIGRLTDEPWVTSISLSRKLNLLPCPAGPAAP